MDGTQRFRRPIGIVAGFVATVLLVNELMLAQGWTLLEPGVNERGSQALHAWLSRPATEDVLIIGSSRVEGGLDARILQRILREEVDPGLSLYKLGLAGLRPLQLSRILEDAVSRRPPRRLLVLAIETRQFVLPAPPPGQRARRPRGEWEVDEIEGAWSVFRGVQSAWNADWVRRRRVQATSAEWAARGGEFLTVAERRKEEADYLRFRARNPQIPDRFDLIQHGWEWTEPGSPDQVGWRRTLQALQALPCEVLFIRMPLEAGFDEASMPVVSRRFFRDIVGGLTERGHAFADLNGEPWPTRKPEMLTRTHLSLQGCDLTSELLAERILAPLLRDGTRPGP